ncbi:MAG: zinc dependent phospholipase C family protein [Bacteroidia bacterium]|nr:zinc dependent phospholipase C family protein [Bacteroidia bacterium]
MLTRMTRLLLPALLALLLPARTMAWGFWAHQRINRLAVFTLPPEMLVLYKAHLEYLTTHAVDPDMRRYAVDGEAERHFMDLDRYGGFPFDTLPRRWQDAVARYTEDSLRKHGILPYHLPIEVYRLKEAFENRDLARILKISADMGHYVGDAHVPLHTTYNYNGQFTGQKGIHGFWESRLPELFAEQYDFFVGRCYYVERLHDETWATVFESHLAVDSVLEMERELSRSFPSDRKYGYESRNNVVMRVYSREYSEAYHRMMSGMVERRMRTAIRRTGSYWYTAWQMAGAPDLTELAKQSLNEQPERYKKRLKIVDREAQEIGMALPGTPAELCCHLPARLRAMGMLRNASLADPAVELMLRRRADELRLRRPWWKRWWQRLF